MQLTDLERALLDAFVAGDHPVLARLRAQFAAATVTSREFSGVGFFTHFDVPASIPRIDTRQWVLSDVDVDLPALEFGAIVMLFVVDGAISMLEGVTLSNEDWPDNESGFVVRYLRRHRPLHPAGWELVSSSTRDFEMFEDDYADAKSRGVAG